MHAQRALKLHGTDEHVFQAISIGTAAELLAKSTLASISFGLVGANTQSVDTVLALDGMPRLEHGLPVMQSTTGKESIERLNRVKFIPSGKLSADEFELLLTVRNTAIHMGVAVPATNAVALGKLVELARRILQHRTDLSESDKDNFWGGQRNAHLVEQLVLAAHEQAGTAYNATISEARRRYSSFFAALRPEGRAFVINQFAATKPLIGSSEQVRPHPCPACGNMGWVVYDVTRGPVQTDYDGDADFHHGVSVWVELEGRAVGFECSVCKLQLGDDDELEFAEVPMEVVLGEDDADAIETGEHAENLYDEEKLR